MSPEEFQIELINSVKKRRKANRISQEELARKSGVSLATIKKIETRGGLTLTTLFKIYKALGELSRLEDLKLPDTYSVDEIFSKSSESNEKPAARLLRKIQEINSASPSEKLGNITGSKIKLTGPSDVTRDRKKTASEVKKKLEKYLKEHEEEK